MIVGAWFFLVFCIILVGFTVLGATFWHWFKLNRQAKKAALAASGTAAGQ